MSAEFVRSEVAEALLKSGGGPPSEVVSEPFVKLVESSGFLNAEPALLEVTEEPLHNHVAQAHTLAKNQLNKPGSRQRIPPEGVRVLTSLIGVDERFLASAEGIGCYVEAVAD